VAVAVVARGEEPAAEVLEELARVLVAEEQVLAAQVLEAQVVRPDPAQRAAPAAPEVRVQAAAPAPASAVVAAAAAARAIQARPE
jgi:hypothetical protein